jgi:transcriptional regulator
MAKDPERVELMKGTLDLLILKSLRRGPMHGHGVAKHIERSSDDVLQVEHGSLYPALHRLERKGWISSGWETLAPAGRELKYYRLTAAGRRQLTTEESKWALMARAIARVLKTT